MNTIEIVTDVLNKRVDRIDDEIQRIQGVLYNGTKPVCEYKSVGGGRVSPNWVEIPLTQNEKQKLQDMETQAKIDKNHLLALHDALTRDYTIKGVRT